MMPTLKQQAIRHTVHKQNPFGDQPLIPLYPSYLDWSFRWLNRPLVYAARQWLNARSEQVLTLLATLLGLILGLVPLALFYLGLSYLLHVVLHFDPTPATPPATIFQGVTYELNWYLVDASLLCFPYLLLIFPLAFMLILARMVRRPFARGRALAARWTRCENNYPGPIKPVTMTLPPFFVTTLPFTAHTANFIAILAVSLLLLYRAYTLQTTWDAQKGSQAIFSLCCLGWPVLLSWQIIRTLSTIEHFMTALINGASYFQALQEGWYGYQENPS